MDDMKTRLIKAARRRLLTGLKAFFPDEADYPQIVDIMPLVDERNLRQDLEYLCMKGYVRWVNNQSKSLDWMWRKYVLTASGVEVADHINVDPALEP